jgi:hypothetical protein
MCPVYDWFSNQIERDQAMHQDLRNFVVLYLRVVVVALLPIALTAFLSIPYSLGGHPGDLITRSAIADLHMT